MDQYQEFIYKRTYSRYLPELGRREEWHETVKRYLDFITQHVEDKYGYVVDTFLYNELFNAIHDMEVMPSMRCLWSAGEALERDNVAGYNCSYTPIESLRDLDELLYILMCGTGVGFSVEEKYTSKIPSVPEVLTYHPDKIIVVKDSKEGWADAFRHFLHNIFMLGVIPHVDFTNIRPAGARLKTFGGRASGPQPLIDLFNFTADMCEAAEGRKLRPDEWADIVCKTAEIVVVGGVRRSSLICLCDLNDDYMRNFKTGQWYIDTPWRAQANISTVYTTRPSEKEFCVEWGALIASNSGERGIFNREASRKKIVNSSLGRDPDYEWGTNPCAEIILRPREFCNLTEVVVRKGLDTKELARRVTLATLLGTFQSTLTNFPYLRDEWRKNCEEERLLGVSLTGVYDHEGISDGTYRDLRLVAKGVNAEYADKLGIPASKAITCVKPSGTVSQLVNAASGFHPRHSEYYIRTVRVDTKDPLCAFLVDQGVPNEPCFSHPDSVTVFSFPQKSEGKVREHLGALEHLDDWQRCYTYWCDHKPSVTINVRDSEWMCLANEVWDDFDDISGISFLPYDGGIYKQAPYQECTERMYNNLKDKMPTIDWSKLTEYEHEDTTTGSRELACASGVCEI